MVFQQLLIDRARRRDLIGEAPDRDAGVVIALSDELPHLAERVLPAILHVHGDVRDLRPDHNAVFIAEIVELLRVLVVGQAQRVRAELPDDGHVRRVILIAQGVALALEILVPAHAAQRVAAAVEEEAFLRIAGKDAAAEAGRDLIPGGQLRRRGVEVGILHPIPEADVLDHKLSRARYSLRLAVYRDVNRFGIVPGLHGDGRGLRFKIDHRRHLDPGRAVLQKLKVLGRHGDQPDRAVKTAIEGEVRLLRVDTIIILVAERKSKRIFVREVLRQLHPEG